MYAIHELQDKPFLTDDISDGAITSSKIKDETIVNADISPTAEIAVSKLQDGSSRQLLQTAANGTDVEWSSNIDIPGTLDVTGNATLDSNLTVIGSADIDTNLNVDGTCTIDGASTFANTVGIGGQTTINAHLDANYGASINNVQIGVAGNSEITTASGNLVIDSATGQTTVDDNLVVTGSLTYNGTFNNLTTTEIAVLDGATVSTAELNILDGVTATTAELNLLDGVTSTTAELNILNGVTATTAEINK